jgi:hypothetical protein
MENVHVYINLHIFKAAFPNLLVWYGTVRSRILKIFITKSFFFVVFLLNFVIIIII